MEAQMAVTITSKRTVFQTIAEHPNYHWPYYRLPDTEYTAVDLGALEHDVHRLASVWFKHDAHDDVEAFICWCPLHHLDFKPHDAHPAWHAQSKPVVPMIRALMLMDLHGWNHETAFVQYLNDNPDLADALGFEQRPDQATLWRARHERFSDELLNAIGKWVRNIRILAGENHVTVPARKTDRMAETDELRPYEQPDDEPTQREIIQRADELTAQAQRRIFPAFTFDRAKQASIPEDAFWELQTYLGLGEDLCANEGARSFITDSTREQTPLGHVHRYHIRQQFSIETIRDMYHEAMQRLLTETTSRSEYFGEAAVAIDTTADDPFTGDREGHEDEIIGTKKDDDEYVYQWATIQTVGWGPRVMLDARPVRKGDTLVEIVTDLLESADDLIRIDRVLMDREFDSQHVLEAISKRGHDYLVPKRKQTSEKAVASRMEEQNVKPTVNERGLHLGNNEWHETNLLYLPKRNFDSEIEEGHERYVVFMSSEPVLGSVEAHIGLYNDRQEIEAGYKQVKRFMAKTTSTDFVLRFFYFAFACLLYSLWRLIDHLVQVCFTDTFTDEPWVTMHDVLTSLKKYTGIG
jgi:IS4 transposase